MKRKMTLLALGAIMAALAARGLANWETPSAATAWEERKPSLLRRSMRPREVKPAPACQRNSRRVRPQKEEAGLLEHRLMTLPFTGGMGVSPMLSESRHGRDARATC